MSKKIKKIIIISSLILIIIILIIINQIHFWKTDLESVCNGGDGLWTGVHGCDNYCDKSSGYCPNKLIFGCECGGDKCWDGKNCVQKSK